MMTISGYALNAPVCEVGDLLLYRATRLLDGENVLLKFPAAPRPPTSLLLRLEHEYELARDLDSSRIARPVALERHAGTAELVLAHGPDRTLASLLGSPMDISSFLSIAIGITAALIELHRHELIHKDIKPEHVLLDGAGHVWLTGLGIASRLPRERQAPAPPEFLAGTLAYMAPEQTGRMNRSIDSRSDLYALGVTFYQMLTGVLPFTASDPMEWVHCHIARQPAPPNQLVAGVPEPLSEMVMRLLAKTAEERYQSTVGLDADLRRCLAQWESDGHIDPFPLGERDVPGRLLIPEKLYGRQSEIEALLAAFNRVVASGSPELILISGYSGIGKTAVVNELHKALVQSRGLFASGKFDQFKRDIPYATLVQALQTLVRQILAKSEAEVAAWRDVIQQAVSPNGQIIVSLIPEVELIIGEQPPVPDLPPQEARNRFQRVLLRFLGVFAAPEHPLALFLDDLQWLDAATLALIGQLAIGQQMRHLFLIGAYRDNEVGPTHPLMRMLDAVHKAEVEVTELVLAPLTPEDVNQLVADSLHCERQHAQPLAELVHRKSGGNPFYAIQFFIALADENLLSFDPGIGGWTWDLPRIDAKGYTDNIVDLMVRRLVRLPASTLDALKHFACLGNTVTIATLCLTRGASEEDLHRSLWEAVLPGLVIRAENTYSFLHDRVQEATYSLIPESERPAMHLHIGRLLASRKDAELKETIFEVVNQFNRATALITCEQERERVAELNLLAGQRAKSATAYGSALTYLDTGEALLPQDRWQARLYALSFTLSLHRAECEFLTNQYAIAEQRLAILTKNARDLVDLAAVTCLGIDLYMTIDRPDRAVDMCLEYLRHLGIDWSVHPSWDEVLPEYDRMWKRIGDRPIEALADLPLMTDPEWRGTIDVLTTVIPPAQVIDSNLLCLILARAVNISLEHGNSDGSCQTYVYVGMLLGQRFENYQATFQFGKLALDLVDNHGLNRFKGRVYVSFGAFLNPWARHISSGRPLILSAFDLLTQSGDFTWAGYCGNNLITNLLASGEPLDEVQREAEHRLQAALKARFGLVIDMVTGQLGLIHALRGLTMTPSSFSTADFNEDPFRDHLESDPRLSFMNCSYWIRKLQACFYAGEVESAIEAAIKAERYLFTFPSFFETAEYHFYSGLAHAAYCLSTDSEGRQQHLEALAIHHQKMAAWAKNSPDNFTDRAYLLAAQMARIEERYWDAQNCYEEAIRAAQKNGFVQNEALAYELASAFYRTRQLDKFADTYLVEARACYARWGAQGKVRQLEQRYPQLREASTPAPTGTFATGAQELDILAIARASQAISGEILIDDLLKTLMRIVLENAGAQQGYLLLMRNEELFSAAVARVENQKVVMHVHGEPEFPQDVLPASILNYVRRSLDKVLLDDATTPNPYSEDEYFSRQHPKSVLCLPIVKQTNLIGLLYLENDLATHAFTPDRLAVLELLAAQAAISLEYALGYEALQESEARLNSTQQLSKVGGWEYDVASGKSFWTEELYRIHELSADPGLDYVQESLKCYRPQDIRTISDAFRGVIERGETYDLEFPFTTFKGRPLWIRTTAQPVYEEGKVVRVIGNLMDITEHKRAEEALRLSSERLQLATRVANIGIWDWDVVKNELVWDDSMYQLYDIRKGDFGGAYDAWIRTIHPEDKAHTDGEIQAALRGEHEYAPEFRIVRTDGTIRYIKADSRTTRDEDGKPLRMIGTNTDITDRKQVEVTIRTLNQELERRVVERTAQLLVANKELEAFAYSVSHDLRAPLRHIDGFLDLLKSRIATTLDEKSQHYMDTISNAVRRMGSLIDDLLAFSRMGRKDMAAEDVNMQALLEEVIHELDSEAQGRDIDWRIGKLPVVTGDRAMLRIVLVNLISNALKFTHKRAKAEIEIGCLPESKTESIVFVRDNGAGFDMQYVQKLFGVFQRLHGAEEFEGTGIGLANVRRIIDRHGGRTWADGKLDNGATFYFALPTGKAVHG